MIACRPKSKMMTSVTLPSNSASLHGGYQVTEEVNAIDSDHEGSRPTKRCLLPPLTESCKKRRKQSTPVRISAIELENNPLEGKILNSKSPEFDIKCPVCQITFNTLEQLEIHTNADHNIVECKREVEDLPNATESNEIQNPVELTVHRSDLSWMPDTQSKEWLGPGIMHFSSTSHMFMPLPQFSQADAVAPRHPIRIFNPDAYCELCNKEFCNKYFLKTHKANKHGIYSEPSVTDSVTGTVNIPSYVTSVKIQSSTQGIDAVPNKIEQKVQSTPNTLTDLFTGPFTNKSLPKMCKSIPSITKDDDINLSNELPNGETDLAPINDDTNEGSSSPRNSNEPMILKNDFSEQENSFYVSPIKSPAQQAKEIDLSNRLRRIGVMNPKAFCEICCKEYCNKYFLRTHKMKRHGIYIPDETKDREKTDTYSGMPWLRTTQTSPLNLIVNEQSTTPTSQGDRKTSSPSDISCEICGIRFQNASLAQLHNVSVHAKVSNREPESNIEEERLMENNDKRPNTGDAISEDLQKLQTMILQLNELDVSKSNNICNACNKEFENRYYLHAHIVTEHGSFLEDMVDNEKSCETEGSANNNTLCDLCGKDFQNIQEMKKHISTYHSSNQTGNELKEEFNGFMTPDPGTNRNAITGQISERRTSMSLTPTSSYCEICNKELCNKYFMKTHMQRMHGIEIENGAQIGGVICDICNKELCSKYFLRVHKHNTHGIVEYGTTLLQPKKNEESISHVNSDTDSSLSKSTDLADLSQRYFTHFTEVCTICSRRFRSTKWLKAHLLSDHGQPGVDKWSDIEQQLHQPTSQNLKSTTAIRNSPQVDRTSPTLKIPSSGQEGNQIQITTGLQNVFSTIFGDDESNTKMYHCTYCSFSTPVLPFLFVHERSHSIQLADGEQTTLKCPVCGQMFHQAELFQHHIFSQHPFLPLPPFFNGSAEMCGEATKEPSESAEEDAGSSSEVTKYASKNKKVKRKPVRTDISLEVGQTLKDVARRSQLPATYALPQSDDSPSVSAKLMQPFLLEEPNPERRFAPSIVFLPVMQKQSSPLTVTFTLTPA